MTLPGRGCESEVLEEKKKKRKSWLSVNEVALQSTLLFALYGPQHLQGHFGCMTEWSTSTGITLKIWPISRKRQYLYFPSRARMLV